MNYSTLKLRPLADLPDYVSVPAAEDWWYALPSSGMAPHLTPALIEETSNDCEVLERAYPDPEGWPWVEDQAAIDAAVAWVAYRRQAWYDAKALCTRLVEAVRAARCGYRHTCIDLLEEAESIEYRYDRETHTVRSVARQLMAVA